MANIVEVRTTAFIDDPWILFSSDAVNHKETYFEGNNRGFDYNTVNQPQLFKMAQHVSVNFDNQTVIVYNNVGPTRKRVCNFYWKNESECTFTNGQTDTSKMSSSYTINSNEANIHLVGSSENPLVNLAPTIDWVYDIKVKKNGTVTVVGAHDGYPCHEIYKKVNGVVWVLHTYQKGSITSLFPPLDVNVNVTV